MGLFSGIAKGLKSGLKGAKTALKGTLKSGLELASGRPDKAVKTLFTSHHNGAMDTLKGGHEIGKAVVPAAATVAGGFFGGPAGAMLGSSLGGAAKEDMKQFDGVFDQMKIADNREDFGDNNALLAMVWAPTRSLNEHCRLGLNNRSQFRGRGVSFGPCLSFVGRRY